MADDADLPGSEVPQQLGNFPPTFEPNAFDVRTSREKPLESSTVDEKSPRSPRSTESAGSPSIATWPDSATTGCGVVEEAAALVGELDRERDHARVNISRVVHSDDLNDYSIFEHVAMDRKRKLLKSAMESIGYERAMGSIVGMAVGDALGHPFEFMPAQDEPRGSYFDLKRLKFYGESNTFRLHRGQWTDDAAMGLCMADSIIMRQAFDGSDMRVRFWCWWNRGMNNAFRRDPQRTSSVGLGGNIAKSLYAISNVRSTADVPAVFKSSGEDAGNGSLMRLTPIAIYLHAAPWDKVHYYARMSSYTTHPGIVAAEACTLLAHIIVKALRLPRDHDQDIKSFIDGAAAEYLEVSGLSKKSGWGYDQMKWLVTSSPVSDTERCWNWRSPKMDITGTLKARGRSYNGYPVSAGYFGSYSLDGLALALWSVYHTTSFDEAVTRCVNLLGDADSHGSICGQIAGAFYGYRAVNPQFVRWLRQWDEDDFALRAVLLYSLGLSGTQAANDPV